MVSEISQIADLMRKSKDTVVVTGAGISTEAGIPDFRGQNGIYRQLGEDKVMRVLNISFFNRYPKEFYKFYRQYFIFPAVPPSQAHLTLAKMEEKGHIKGVVTQNIDNLHQQAGSKNVIPVHGNAGEFICTSYKCRQLFDIDYYNNSPEIVPRCSSCGSIVKPNVVLFGENINNYMGAQQMILDARLIIVIGSSLTVYPLAGFVAEFSTFTQDLVIINRGPTQLDHAARVKIDPAASSTGKILEEIYRQLG